MTTNSDSAATPSPRWRTLVADPPWKYDTDGTHLRASAAYRPNRSGVTLLGAPLLGLGTARCRWTS